MYSQFYYRVAKRLLFSKEIKMNILFVANDSFPHVGGKSTHIQDLKDGMESLGHNCYVISASDFPSNYNLLIKIILYPFWILNKKLYRKAYTKLYRKIMANLIRKYCVENKVDIISAQDVYATNSCEKALKRVNIPLVLTMHTYFGIERTLDNNSVKNDPKEARAILQEELSSLNFCKSIVAVDTRIKNHVIDSINNFSNSKIKVSSIPNFTNIERFKPISEDMKKDLRIRYNLPLNKFIVLCSRRLVEKNGVFYAVKALEMLSPDSNALLLIVGEGPQKARINKYIIENNLEDKVLFYGEVENSRIQEFYQMADISIVPSITVNGLQEATSVSAIESMACGIPVIASSIGGLKELIENNINGLLTPELDFKEIARCINILEKDKVLYEKISLNSIDYIKKFHSHNSASKLYLNEFQSVLK